MQYLQATQYAVVILATLIGGLWAVYRMLIKPEDPKNLKEIAIEAKKEAQEMAEVRSELKLMSASLSEMKTDLASMKGMFVSYSGHEERIKRVESDVARLQGTIDGITSSCRMEQQKVNAALVRLVRREGEGDEG